MSATVTHDPKNRACPCCHVDDATWREMDAALAASRPLLERKAPTGWHKRHAAVLAELRRRFLADEVEIWALHPHGAPAGHVPSGRYAGEPVPAVPRGGVSVRFSDGRRWAGTIPELGDLFGVSAPARAPKAATTPRRTPRPRRTEVPNTVTESETPMPTTTPAAPVAVPSDRLADYLDRLVYAPKRTYAADYAAHLIHGAPCPTDPGSEWAPKVRAKVSRLVGRQAVAA